MTATMTAASFQTIPAIARYGNLVFMERPVHTDDVFSRRHPKMTLLNRAKIFAPFAALVGFDEHIRSKDVPYEWKHELDADEEWELNRRLDILRGLTYNSKLARRNAVTVTIEYYVPCTDRNSEAHGSKGLYESVTGIVKRVDTVNQAVTVTDSDCLTHTIHFSDIYTITDPQDRLFGNVLPDEA